MNIAMLVTTFRNDIDQFKMFCHCLNKNWQGPKSLIVCLGQGDDLYEFQDITNTFFDRNWNIEIKPTIYNYRTGTTEQQVNTVYYSLQANASDVIIWDCKDFLLRPCNESIFVENEKFRWPFIMPDKKLIDTHYNYNGLVDEPIDHLQRIDNLRPWIWNVEHLSRYWTRLNQRFGHFSTWIEYPGGNEIHGYYICVMTDTSATLDFFGPENTPLLIGGGWTHQTYEGMLQEVRDFDQWPERKVWKHSRKLEDLRCLDITRSVLLKYGIGQEIVDRVF